MLICLLEEKADIRNERKVVNVKLFSGWKSHIRRKLKFCFSESRLSANLKILTDLNRDLVTLSTPFQRQSNAGEEKPTCRITEKMIDEHRVVGIAAEEIWRFLIRLECDGCEENDALLGIGDESLKQDRATPDLTQFDMALRCIRTSPDLSKFLVTTKLQAQDSSHNVMHVEQLQAMLQSVLKIEQSPSERLEQGMGDRVTNQARTSAPCDGPSSAKEHSRPDGERKASDLCGFLSHPAFDRVSGSIQAFSACDEGAKASNSKAVCERAPGTLRSTTLHELLQTCSPNRLRDSLPVPERLRLAKILCVAYFRFHSTGWADSGWNSKCISFQRTEKDGIISDVTSLHMPYLQSRVYSTSSLRTSSLRTSSLRTSSLRTSSVSQSAPTFSPSSASIFNLGVLLLEIGCSKNWDTLDRARPAHFRNDDLLSAALQARTLQANELFEMGGTYRKIVSKLIECAFGNVYDLDDPKDEAAFLDAVIKPLEEEERRLRKFLSSNDRWILMKSRHSTEIQHYRDEQSVIKAQPALPPR